ncbi:MAG TPA: sigma 54-interacting transcriptional regulator [Clostridia bacterium]|nr:sigma 54-interacting transcriptional regulator [Clostridia bacterium]
MHSLLQKILNEIKLAVIILDSNENIIYANQHAGNLFEGSTNIEGEIAHILKADIDHKKGEKIECNSKILLPSWTPITIGKRHYTLFCFEDCTYKEELEELNYCFSTILNSINEGVLLVDSDGMIRFYNNQLRDFEGLSPDMLLGKHITEVYKVNALESEHLTVLKTKSPIIDRYQKYKTVQNREVHLVASTYPILKSGRIISTYSISRNLSKVKELLDNTKLLQKDFTPIVENLIADEANNNTRYSLDSIVGNSPEIRSLIEKARRAAHVLSPLLIYGETGTGKELFVQGIHNENSITRNHPFIAINCAAIPESLLESLLFGTVQGAFTGSRNTTGLIEQADYGTLFLDEINSMPLGLQAKLLRVLQENKYRKLGGKEELPVNCRIISSTNIAPSECVKKSLIRKDLYYRLSVISFTIPPLRDRPEDILTLADHFIKLFSMKYGRPIIPVSDKLKAAFLKYDWPGNVRELEHIIESTVTMIDDENTILPGHLPSDMISKLQIKEESKTATLAEILLEAETKAISDTLEEYCWNISKSAAALGISRQNLQYRIRKLSINRHKS